MRLPFDLPPEQPNTVVTPSLVEDLSCLVLGAAKGLADDLAVYLVQGGAVVNRSLDIAAAQQWIASCPSGLYVVVIDTAGDKVPLDELRAAVKARRNVDMRFVIIGRGGLRKYRIMADGHIELDADVMHRIRFLEAVAVAAGRINQPKLEISSGEDKSFAPLSREEAQRRGNLILVAEDNKINQRVLMQQLLLLGRTADIANNGREALELWQKGGYGLLLTDLHMPEMDGYELTSAIRAIEIAGADLADKPRLPIIAITANALKGEAEHCREIGMDDYLSKPIQLVNLKSMVEKWLPLLNSESAPVETTSTETTPPVPPISGIPVDVNVLKALVGDDEAMIRDFLHDFRLSAAKIAVELRTTCAAQQTKEASGLAHKLKSSARSVGALVLGELCFEIENAGKRGDNKQLMVLLPKFEQELTKVEGFLNKY